MEVCIFIVLYYGSEGLWSCQFIWCWLCGLVHVSVGFSRAKGTNWQSRHVLSDVCGVWGCNESSIFPLISSVSSGKSIISIFLVASHSLRKCMMSNSPVTHKTVIVFCFEVIVKTFKFEIFHAETVFLMFPFWRVSSWIFFGFYPFLFCVGDGVFGIFVLDCLDYRFQFDFVFFIVFWFIIYVKFDFEFHAEPIYDSRFPSPFSHNWKRVFEVL